MKDILNRTFRPLVAVGQGPRRLAGRIPTDLVGVAGFVLVAAALLTVADVTSTVARAAIGFPLLFLTPGYAVVAVLFPRASPIEPAGGTRLVGQTGDISDRERGALAFGLSVALLPLFGLALSVSPWGLTGPSVVATVSGFVLVGVVVAAFRRFRLPVRERYRFRLGRKLAFARASLFDTRSTVHTAASLLLVASTVIALASVGFALLSPQQGEQYTNLQLLTEDESGELVADDYPSAVEPDESVSMTLSVDNREGEATEYTAVVQEQWVDDGEVLERAELERTEYSVGDGETVTDQQEFTPNADSGTVRVAVLLYDGEVPETPTTENAYRHTYVWIDVTEDAALEDE